MIIKQEELVYKKYIILDNKIIDIWILNKDINLNEIVMKQDEVVNAKYVSLCEFKKMLITVLYLRILHSHKPM